jgi:putative membrane protein
VSFEPLNLSNHGAGFHVRNLQQTAVFSIKPMETPMKTTILALALASAFATAAFAQSVGEKTGVNSAFGIAPKTEDFIKEAATSDMLEIEAAKIAQQKGNAHEKKFAEQMITDHTKTSAELKQMVPAELTPAIPTSLDDSSQKKLGKLRDAKTDDFSSDYDSMQLSAHKDAVSLFERYAQGGDNAKLKDWAGKTLPALQHHLQMAEQMDKTRK